ncbi:MAG TPA: DUF2147 domain-containing protein [Methylotenera sp.]|nr:DUF2147 domain-containing protein [Methylotenera sp.]HPH04573.1 DUF2147 domain-containing protein [Methylotenera sp.]HPN00752.1 DUF2147 domain-containing protein [Methylotenera sp.]
MRHFLVLTVLFLFSRNVNALENTPAGLWKTFDDKGKATGYIRVMENQDIYTGVIEKGLPTDKEDKFCSLCKGERKDKKLIGMTVIKNVKANGDSYEGSEILDPFSGNTYRVKLTLKEAGKKMEVRGFVGISLFGRTQIWERENE